MATAESILALIPLARPTQPLDCAGMAQSKSLDDVRDYLSALQEDLLKGLQATDPRARLTQDAWQRPEGGGGRTWALADGLCWEKAAVNYSEVYGKALPPSASARRPELAGQPYLATGVSVIIHPRNPYVPTAHLNVRYFSTLPADGSAPLWWFGGGFDLTPCYGFAEDARQWHLRAREACAPFGNELYPRFKQQCDSYFHLPHRQETRGIGGLFFDDFNELGWQGSLAFWQRVGSAFGPAYFEIADRRRDTPYGARERHWQAVRRGRYVEFNLLYDRGTLFGLQSGGRTESILASLPPQVQWHYQHTPEPGSPEARLLEDFLHPRDWLKAPA